MIKTLRPSSLINSWLEWLSCDISALDLGQGSIHSAVNYCLIYVIWSHKFSETDYLAINSSQSIVAENYFPSTILELFFFHKLIISYNSWGQVILMPSLCLLKSYMVSNYQSIKIDWFLECFSQPSHQVIYKTCIQNIKSLENRSDTDFQ